MRMMQDRQTKEGFRGGEAQQTVDDVGGGASAAILSNVAHGAVGVRGVVLGDEADEETRPQLGLTPGLNAAPKEAPRLLALGKWNTRRICKLQLDGASCGRTKKSKATNLTMKNTLGARWHVR
jgi:hypothetical protein